MNPHCRRLFSAIPIIGLCQNTAHIKLVDAIPIAHTAFEIFGPVKTRGICAIHGIGLILDFSKCIFFGGFQLKLQICHLGFHCGVIQFFFLTKFSEAIESDTIPWAKPIANEFIGIVVGSCGIKAGFTLDIGNDCGSDRMVQLHFLSEVIINQLLIAGAVRRNGHGCKSGKQEYK